jgi:hypothetical protein
MLEFAMTAFPAVIAESGSLKLFDQLPDFLWQSIAPASASEG